MGRSLLSSTILPEALINPSDNLLGSQTAGSRAALPSLGARLKSMFEGLE